jgi:hypothetical protein
MPEVIRILKGKGDNDDLKLIMSNLYPNEAFARQMNTVKSSDIIYETTPVDATIVDEKNTGLRPMEGSLNHMKLHTAKKILTDTMKSQQPSLTFEISDNSYPKALWWVAIPFNIISSLFVSAMARPYTVQQFFFTYIVPFIPITFAWDGAVSNARTYTLNDLDFLLKGMESEKYSWEKGVVKGKSKKIYLLGIPKQKHTPID